MLYQSHDAEQAHLLATAQAMCAAARTAPKTKGQDYLETCIVTGDDLEPLAAKMEELSDAHNAAFLRRDAGNVRSSGAVVILGAKNVPHGLNGLCQYCGFADCAAASAAGAACVYTSMDLGIAIGSASAIAADNRVDSRVMFSAGRTALALGLLPDCSMAIAIPLSVSGKSPYFDRK